MVQSIAEFIAGNGLVDQWSMRSAYAISAIILLLACLLAYLISKMILLRILGMFIKRSKNSWDDKLLAHKVFERLVLVIPALVLYAFAPVFPTAQVWLQRIALCIIIFSLAFSFDRLLNAVDEIYRGFEASKTRPIKGYLQLIKILAYLIGAVVIVSVLIDRSPLLILGGIGAATAVLLLIFQNTILGLVASIQLTENDMVRIGDWIEMPGHNASGIVTEITLHTVKVQNWDNTITTIPTYALVSESFKNWRAMQEAGGRRIERALYIDMSSVKFCDEDMLVRFKNIRILESYLANKLEEINAYNAALGIGPSDHVNGRHLTNIGTFRAYVSAYLKNHPKIHKGMTHMVRQLEPTEHGIPLQVYAFTNITAWEDYEGVQADIFDHIISVLPQFELRVFQSPTGHDISERRIIS